jgi:peptidoglycan/xylan/chitin deacetylase (PgdA/CDA1 family)
MLFKVFAAAALFSAVLVKATPTPAELFEREGIEIYEREPSAELSERAPLAQVISKCTVAKTVALTFDDGPWSYIYVCIIPLPCRLLLTP